MLKTGFLSWAMLLAVTLSLPGPFAAAQTAAPNNPRSNPAAQPAGATPPKTMFASLPNVVAEVNGDKITKDELAFEALKMHGREEVEEFIGLAMVMQECKRRNITLTDEEARAEIERFAAQFGMPVDQWLEYMKKDHGLSYEQYLAKLKQRVGIRKIAGQNVKVTNEEIQRKFDAQYGEGVMLRQIVLFDKAKGDLKTRGDAILRELQTNPSRENFISLAKLRSDDPVSAAQGGFIGTFRRFSMPDNMQVENLLINLKEGETTGLVPIDGFFVIFRCEKYVPAANVDRRALSEKLFYQVEEEKINKAMVQILPQIYQQSQITNFFDSPQAQGATQYPTIIATVNGESITSQAVAETCALRYGGEVLQGLIIHRIIQQKCKEVNITVSREEIDAELVRIAAKILPLAPDGRPNVAQLIEMQCRDMKIDPAVYYSKVLWPGLALKKMAQPAVQVTQEDMNKAYEATYGPRVEVLAIFLNEERKAYDVWAQARKAYDPNKQLHEQLERVSAIFGQLAAQHSVEQVTAANFGMIEPVARHGRMPKVEEIAFALQPGEISEVIPFDTIHGKQFMILLCLGMTDPVLPDAVREDVNKELYEHIYDRKLEIEVAQILNRLMTTATVDNYLTGKTQGPNMAGAPTQSTFR